MKTPACLALILVAFLLGCSSTTTVHLHAVELPETDQEKIRTELENKGFSVITRKNELPLQSNAIFYSSHKGIEKDLKAIEDVLEKQGLKAVRSYAVQTNNVGRHEYTAKNIGVYLAAEVRREKSEVASRVRSVFPLAMTDAEFVSTDCPTEYVYQFDNKKVTVVDLSLPIDESDIATAEWQQTEDNAIVIFHGHEEFKYKKIKFHREHSTQYHRNVVTYTLLLEPLDYYRAPFGCTYKATYFEVF